MPETISAPPHLRGKQSGKENQGMLVKIAIVMKKVHYK